VAKVTYWEMSAPPAGDEAPRNDEHFEFVYTPTDSHRVTQRVALASQWPWPVGADSREVRYYDAGSLVDAVREQGEPVPGESGRKCLTGVRLTYLPGAPERFVLPDYPPREAVRVAGAIGYWVSHACLALAGAAIAVGVISLSERLSRILSGYVGEEPRAFPVEEWQYSKSLVMPLLLLSFAIMALVALVCKLAECVWRVLSGLNGVVGRATLPARPEDAPASGHVSATRDQVRDSVGGTQMANAVHLPLSPIIPHTEDPPPSPGGKGKAEVAHLPPGPVLPHPETPTSTQPGKGK
jgi:hypothetical protein